jgi:hypothetical protein
MKTQLVMCLLATAVLGGCQDAGPASSAGAKQGRYVGVGHYAPGDMWKQVVRQASKDPAAAVPADDEQIIIVMDGVSGEVRQCGNLSGFCIAMNPWAKALPQTQTAPLPMAKHAEQLAAEAEARAKASAPAH